MRASKRLIQYVVSEDPRFVEGDPEYLGMRPNELTDKRRFNLLTGVRAPESGPCMVKRPDSCWGLHVYPTFDVQATLRELGEGHIVEPLHLDPILVGGCKADLRVHVVTLCFGGGLQALLHPDFLVRVCAEKFDPASAERRVHVTNPRHGNACLPVQDTPLDTPQIRESVARCIGDTLSVVPWQQCGTGPDFWLWGFDLFVAEDGSARCIELNSQPAARESPHIRHALYATLIADCRDLMRSVAAGKLALGRWSRIAGLPGQRFLAYG